jgi:hypothetical protein
MVDDARLMLTADRQEITHLLHLYARGIDRCDEAALLSVWADNATVDYGSGASDAVEWSCGVLERLRPMAHTMHALSNMLIDIEGDSARAETYCQAYHQFTAEDGTLRRMIVGGRYIDRLVRTDQGWRIRARVYAIDWNEDDASSCRFDGPYARFTHVGGRYPDDALYR